MSRRTTVILASPPTRRRGLKRSVEGLLHWLPPVASHAEAWIETAGCLINSVKDWIVASHAEAWIETPVACLPPRTAGVASHAEAWIETPLPALGLRKVWSPPTRRRGLKRANPRHPMRAHGVASHAEAWIETLGAACPVCKPLRSPPTRRRGLKLSLLSLMPKLPPSPPTRRRGLKHLRNEGRR